MNILMMTNTYTPLVGGLERSVKTFAEEYRRRGHRVVIVAPTFKRMPEKERDVIRVPALKEIGGTEFSARLPIPGWMTKHLEGFRPDIVHAHHPFLLGDTAFRVATTHQVPLVYTHHTLFEQCTHYLPMRADKAARFMMRLATSYGNLCDRVFAPSESVARLLRQRGVQTPVAVVPTGIDIARFQGGRGSRFRRHLKIPNQAFIVGHLGRLAPEKNLGFLTEAVVEFLHRDATALFVVVGRGPSASWIKRLCTRGRVRDRIYFTGVLRGQDLIDAYDAMDVFAFASKSETQGLVLLEAMAAGVPVVALDAPGVREVVRDRRNGRLLTAEEVGPFADALRWFSRLSPARRRVVRQAARQMAETFSVPRCAERALQVYASLSSARRTHRKRGKIGGVVRRMQTEWRLLRKMAGATKSLFSKATTRRRKGRMSPRAEQLTAPRKLQTPTQMLRTDHRNVKKLFRQFDAATSFEAKRKLCDKTIAELQVHTKLEEEIFYPAVRQHTEQEALMDESEQEHHVVDVLIGELQGMKPMDQSGQEEFAARFKVMVENIEHHIEEEEGEMFPKVERSDMAYKAIAAQMVARKEALQREMPGKPEHTRRPV